MTENEKAARDEFETATIHLIFAICERLHMRYLRGLLDYRTYKKECNAETRTLRAVLGNHAKLDFKDSTFPTIIRTFEEEA